MLLPQVLPQATSQLNPLIPVTYQPIITVCTLSVDTTIDKVTEDEEFLLRCHHSFCCSRSFVSQTCFTTDIVYHEESKTNNEVLHM